jgi:tetratricopeptide (TPR) repeat protein
MPNSIYIFFTTPLGTWIAAIFTIAPVVFMMTQSLRKRLRLKNLEIEQLHELNETRSARIKFLEQELKQSKESIQFLEQQQPEAWLQDVAKERKANNEERAVKRLRNGFEAICQPLSHVSFELATHHFNVSVDYGHSHFQEAKRQAHIAALLCPEHTEANAFLAELLAIEADEQFAADHHEVFHENWNHIEDFLEIKNHPEIIPNLVNRANQYIKQGYYQLAERLYQRILVMLKRHFDADSPSVLNARAQCAYLAGVTGHYHKALALFKALLTDEERVLGKDHPNTLTTRGNIARWIGETGDSAQALELFNALLPDFERVLGKDHPDTLTTRGNTVRWTGKTGDSAQALKLFNALLTDRERVLGKDHPDTLATRNNIASWTGDSAQALKLFNALLPDFERVLGKDHPDTLATRNNIASCTGETGETGDRAQALELLKALLPDRERVLGKDHPDTLRTRHNIAYWIAQTGDSAQALELLKALLSDQERVLGKDHPDTLTTRSNMAYWIEKAV